MEEFLTQESKVWLESRNKIFGSFFFFFFFKEVVSEFLNKPFFFFFFKKHENEFNEEVALTEIYKYIVKYFDEVRFLHDI